MRIMMPKTALTQKELGILNDFLIRTNGGKKQMYGETLTDPALKSYARPWKITITRTFRRF